LISESWEPKAKCKSISALESDFGPPKKDSQMLKNVAAPGVALAALTFSTLIFSPLPRAYAAAPQSAAEDQADQELDGWERPITRLPKNSKPAPAPRRDISGI
jgi:hypothetical protein